MDSQISIDKGMGRRIAQRRKELGLTQEAASEKCGLSKQFFATIESGSKNLRGETLLKLARGLGVSADYILTGRVVDIDLSDVVSKMGQLSGDEYNHLSTIIDEYLLALGYKP